MGVIGFGENGDMVTFIFSPPCLRIREPIRLSREAIARISFIGFGGKACHKIEFETCPSIGESFRKGLEKLFLCEIFVDYITQALRFRPLWQK